MDWTNQVRSPRVQVAPTLKRFMRHHAQKSNIQRQHRGGGVTSLQLDLNQSAQIEGSEDYARLNVRYHNNRSRTLSSIASLNQTASKNRVLDHETRVKMRHWRWNADRTPSIRHFHRSCWSQRSIRKRSGECLSCTEAWHAFLDSIDHEGKRG